MYNQCGYKKLYKRIDFVKAYLKSSILKLNFLIFAIPTLQNTKKYRTFAAN
jgi:hypothetical protein